MKKTLITLTLVLVLLANVVAYASTTEQAVAPANIEGYVYADGTYRGGYIDPAQIEVQFELKDNQFVSIKYRALGYRGVDYLKSEDAAVVGVTTQYQELADYLIGKDVSALKDLYYPENIAKDTDTFSAATIRSSKLISSINDGLNRGLYALPKDK